jgi:polar amino acid transport system substrate-binding protein
MTIFVVAMKTKKSFSLGAIGFALWCFISLQVSPLFAEELEIGFSFDIPPYVMNKGTEGIELEIVREALKYKNHTFRVRQCSYKQLETAVSKLGLDAAAAVREQNDGTYYSDYFVSFENCAITKKKFGITLNGIYDLKGKSIITWQNAHRDLGNEFGSLFSPDNAAPYREKYDENPDQQEQVRLFWLGNRDVIIIDKSIFIWFTKSLFPNNALPDEPVYHTIFPVPTEFQVNFKSREIRDDFNEGLQHIRQNGVYKQILSKYLE